MYTHAAADDDAFQRKQGHHVDNHGYELIHSIPNDRTRGGVSFVSETEDVLCASVFSEQFGDLFPCAEENSGSGSIPFQTSVSAAGTKPSVRFNADMSHFSGGIQGAVQNFSVENDAAADPCPKCDAGQIGNAFSTAEKMLPPGGKTAVLRDLHFFPQMGLKEFSGGNIYQIDVGAIHDVSVRNAGSTGDSCSNEGNVSHLQMIFG